MWTVMMLSALAVIFVGPDAAHAKLAANRLAANRLPAHKVAAGTAAANPLAVGKKFDKQTFQANPEAVNDLLATSEGREVLTFLVSCALPERSTLRAPDPGGGEFECFGELGLAKSWTKHSLNAAGRGWISACLFARTNVNNVANPISMRGPLRALATTPEEEATWSLEEGAFYGDYFTPNDESIACRGADQAAGESGGLVTRDCTEPDP